MVEYQEWSICFAFYIWVFVVLWAMTFCWSSCAAKGKKGLKKNKSERIERIKKAKESNCQVLQPYFPLPLRTDCHSDHCHGNVWKSLLLGCRNRFLQPQPPDSFLPFGLCAVLGRWHCHFPHLFLLVQQLVPHKHSFLSLILHLLLCAFLFVAVYQCRRNCVEPLSFPYHASFSSVKYH